jgi:hypothetical protein
MLRVNRHQSESEESDVQYGLIWHWRTLNNRRLIGHGGSMIGVTHGMMANEKRDLGVIVLTNGDVTKFDDMAKQVYETTMDIIGHLFDCFDK